jgi:beta-glucosidase
MIPSLIPEMRSFQRTSGSYIKYIYPYISSASDADRGRFYYPAKYENVETPSLAGGGEGGNPSLYETFVQASVEVKNTGTRTGKEVVQLYVSFPDNVVDTDDQRQYQDPIDFPVRVLRNFTKVELQPGQSTNVELSLNRKDFSYWSTQKQNWVMPVNGTFKIWVGRSSRDLPLVGEY